MVKEKWNTEWLFIHNSDLNSDSRLQQGAVLVYFLSILVLLQKLKFDVINLVSFFLIHTKIFGFLYLWILVLLSDTENETRMPRYIHISYIRLYWKCNDFIIYVIAIKFSIVTSVDCLMHSSPSIWAFYIFLKCF